MPSLFLGKGDSTDMSMQFPQELMEMFDTDLARKEGWRQHLDHENKRFLPTAVAQPQQDAQLRKPKLEPWSFFPDCPKTLKELEELPDSTIVKQMAGKDHSYSLFLVSPSATLPAGGADPHTLQLYVVAEASNATLPHTDWAIAPGACEWILDQATVPIVISPHHSIQFNSSLFLPISNLSFLPVSVVNHIFVCLRFFSDGNGQKHRAHFCI